MSSLLAATISSMGSLNSRIYWQHNQNLHLLLMCNRICFDLGCPSGVCWMKLSRLKLVIILHCFFPIDASQDELSNVLNLQSYQILIAAIFQAVPSIEINRNYSKVVRSGLIIAPPFF